MAEKLDPLIDEIIALAQEIDPDIDYSSDGLEKFSG
jgi:hypothetical protein